MRLLGLLGAVLAWRDEHGRLLPYYLRPSQSWFDMHNLTNPGPRVTFNLTGAMELAARTPCKVCNRTGPYSYPCGDHCVASRARCNVPPSFGCAIMHPAQKCTCNPFKHFSVRHTRCSFQTKLYHLSSRQIGEQQPYHIGIGENRWQAREAGVAGTVIRVAHDINQGIAWHDKGTHHACATKVNAFGVRECHCCNCYDTPAYPEYGHKMRVVDSCQHAGVHKLRGVFHLRPTTDRNPRIVHCHRGWMLVAMVHIANDDDVAQPVNWFQRGHNAVPLEYGNVLDFRENQEPSAYPGSWLQPFFDHAASKGQRIVGKFVLHNGKLPNITRTFYKELNNRNWPKLFANDDVPTKVCHDASLTKSCKMGTIKNTGGRVRLQHMGAAMNLDGTEPLYYASGLEVDKSCHMSEGKCDWPYNYRSDEHAKTSWGHGLHLWISAM